MMSFRSYEFYELLKILGIIFVFTALGGVAIHAANGGTKQTSRTRLLTIAVHGIGSLLILTGGFGMLARRGYFANGGGLAALPTFIWIKLVCWVVLSAVIFTPYRKPAAARWLFIGLPFVAVVAVYMALAKPFA
ncbi:MAG: hypothetical protein MUF00_16440 [Gemmatimonadaceae bacterium]|jgi:cytochrome bd-type quinol oxidase subunit 2|nr:hypothetical protein [Gemmatimonadaceae bacterium]